MAFEKAIKVVGNRTYAAGLTIILHQVLNELGLKDITGEQVSALIDLGLGALVLLFRKLAADKAKKDVEIALKTPVPKP